MQVGGTVLPPDDWERWTKRSSRTVEIEDVVDLQEIDLPERKEPAKVTDLMAALEASVAASRKKKSTTRASTSRRKAS